MKQNFKQWAWRTLLTLTCLITGFTQADAWFVYVDKASFNAISSQGDGNLYIYTWNGIDLGGWPGAKFEQTVTDENNKEWLFMDINAGTFNYKLNLGDLNSATL